MLGLIQKLFLELVELEFGRETLNQILHDAEIPISQNFRMDTVYPDEQWHSLFKSALKILNITETQAYTLYAKYFVDDAHKRFPIWFQMSKNSYEFLAKQPVIHNNFATGVADKKARQNIEDKFNVEMMDKKLITLYRSKNKHCGLYKMLAQEVVDRYNDQAEITETKCMHEGHDECEIHISWSQLSDAT